MILPGLNNVFLVLFPVFKREPYLALARKTVGVVIFFYKNTFSFLFFLFLIDSPYSSTRRE